MNDPILEVIDRQIAQLQVTRATYLGQGHATTQPTAQPSTKKNKVGKKPFSEETRAKMKVSSQARYARIRAEREAAKQANAATRSAEPVVAPTQPAAEPTTVGEKAKAKSNKIVVQPAATSAAQSIMPNQPA